MSKLRITARLSRYLDDWITQVYKPVHSEMLPSWKVAHHNSVTRYVPDTNQGSLLADEVMKGTARLEAWLAAQNSGGGAGRAT